MRLEGRNARISIFGLMPRRCSTRAWPTAQPPSRSTHAVSEISDDAEVVRDEQQAFHVLW